MSNESDERYTPTLYGIWIPGTGWLRNGAGRAFATDDHAVAESARALYGGGAQIMAIDAALDELQGVMLDRERERAGRSLKARIKRWLT